MKLQTLEYFVQITNEGSYTRAAKKCFVSQPALSKSISEYESELGCVLFQRKDGKLVLTEQGDEVYYEATRILEHCKRLKEKISKNISEKKPIRVGYIIYGHIEFFQRRTQWITNVKIESIYDSAMNIRTMLMNNEIDFALLPNSSADGLEGTETHAFTKRNMYILVHQNHSLYCHNEVTFEMLKGIPIISWDKTDLTLTAKAYDDEFAEHGVRPCIVARARKMGDMVNLIHQHHAIGISGPITTILFSGEYKLIPIVDSKKCYGLSCVWKKNSSHPDIEKVIATFNQ